MDWGPFYLTLRLATTTTLLLVLLGVPLAAWLSRTKARWTTIIDVLVALPLVLPPTVLGYFFLRVLGVHGALGRGLARVLGAPLPFSFAGLVVASCVYSLPFLVGPMKGALGGIDPRLLEGAACLGASPLRTFFRVTCPLAWPGMVAGIALTFAHTVGEFGVVLMVGGNIPGVTRTVSIAVFDELQALDYESAGRTSLTLLGFSCAILCASYALQRRRWPS